MIEKTLVIIKPDAVKRKLIGKIITRFENADLNIEMLEKTKISSKTAEKLYSEHFAKPFFEDLIKFIANKPIVIIIISGDNVISKVRKMVGSTKPCEAHPGTIRGDYASTDDSRNLIHASDSKDSAEYEISLMKKEVLNRGRCL